jgi:hypothetical protein
MVCHRSGAVRAGLLTWAGLPAYMVAIRAKLKRRLSERIACVLCASRARSAIWLSAMRSSYYILPHLVCSSCSSSSSSGGGGGGV